MTNREGEFTFLIEKKLGVINTSSTGWKKELNIVQWNGGNSKYDVRDWDPEHEHMSKGITLREDEARKLAELLWDHFSTKEETQHDEKVEQQSADQPVGNC